MKEPNILYHYTSIDALFAIINGINNNDENNVFFTLRATHAGFLNDDTEGKLIPNVLRELGINDSTLLILQSLQGSPFVCSLSELDDDLNMWRCYANDGTGVAIGLNYCKLKELLVDELKKIEYLSHDEIKNRLLSNGIEQMLQKEDKMPLSRLLHKALHFKHPSFSAEKEWRISKYWVEDDFRLTNGIIIPFVKFQIPISAIETIMLGPKCEYAKNKFSIRRMLQSKIPSCELNKIQIINSKIPLI